MAFHVGKYVAVILVLVCEASCFKNVLLIIADDFRPEAGAYYMKNAYLSSVHPNMHTPNIDKLASKGILFKNAHVQQPVCGPSRASFLTGRRPETTHVNELAQYFRHNGGNFTTIPEFFKLNGYTSVGMGKIFHLTSAGGYDPPSWSMPFFDGTKNHEVKGVTWNAVPDASLVTEKLIDQQIAEHAVQTLTQLAPMAKQGDNPFFMAVGFHKPHLPWVFPASFLKYYPESEVRLPNNPYAPVNMPDIARFPLAKIKRIYDMRDGGVTGDANATISNQTTLELRRAYYSAVSYMDSLVGQVVNSLEHLGLADDTVVAFIGDHGWQLGEHGEWGKRTSFQLGTHAPMIIRIPGRTDKGIQVNNITEFVDLFPTLAEAAGFNALPVCPDDSSNVSLCTEGISLLPYIDKPTSALKTAVFSQTSRLPPKFDTTVMGFSIKTTNYRYTEWVDFSNNRPDWNQIIAKEFYDHTVDPDENYNRVDDPAYTDEVQMMGRMLHGGWRSAIISSSSTTTTTSLVICFYSMVCYFLFSL